MRLSHETHYSVVGAIFICAAFASAIAAWVTHLIWIIHALASDQGATVGQMVLGFLGAFMPPIGIIHGYIIWLS